MRRRRGGRRGDSDVVRDGAAATTVVGGNSKAGWWSGHGPRGGDSFSGEAAEGAVKGHATRRGRAWWES